MPVTKNGDEETHTQQLSFLSCTLLRLMDGSFLSFLLFGGLLIYDSQRRPVQYLDIWVEGGRGE
jgi:hypothetical protein